MLLHKTWKQVNPYFGEKEGYGDFPKVSGNYAIYIQGRGLVYIGTAQNLYNRLNKHEVIRTARAIQDNYVYIKVKIMIDDWQRKKQERKLILKLKPPCNGLPLNRPKRIHFRSN